MTCSVSSVTYGTTCLYMFGRVTKFVGSHVRSCSVCVFACMCASEINMVFVWLSEHAGGIYSVCTGACKCLCRSLCECVYACVGKWKICFITHEHQSLSHLCPNDHE